MTKAELLSKLDEEALRKIAKNEELSIPKNYGKRDLVKYLNGMLTLEKIKEYTAEVYEKETKRTTVIHETIKEKGIRIKAKETTKIKFDKLEVIRELTQEEKIDLSVLDDIAKNLGEPAPKGKGFSLYDKMSDKMLDYLNRIFVKKESEGHGLFLEYRTANFIKCKNKKVNQIRIRVKPCLEVKQLDVVGFDSKDIPLVMAECKDTSVKVDYLDKWIENTKRLFDFSKGILEESFFVTSKKLTEECLRHIETHKDIDAKRGQLKVVGGWFERGINYLSDNRDLNKSGRVYLSIYEVRQNEFTKVFPKK